jgi:hypothetical protein
MDNQINELIELFNSRFPEGIPKVLVSDFENLALDVILTKSRSTLGADGTAIFVQGLRFGDSFERVKAAVFARERDFIHDRLPTGDCILPE